MKLKVCAYCGTEYNSDRETCPLCGKTEQEAREAAPKPAKAEATGNSEKIPQWMWILTCALLAVAVVVGLVYFLVSMEYIGGKDNVEPVISAPVVEEPVVEVTVVEEPVDRSCKELTLSQTLLTLEELGGHVFLTALTEPVDCDDEVTFSSRNEEIATVDESGMITAVAPGKTEVLVTCGSVLEICTVVCDFEVEETEEPTEEEPTEEEPVEEEPTETEEPAVEASLSSEDFTLFRPGEETYLTVKNAPENAVITYASSDASVATVSDTGKVVAVGDGTATITVTVDGKTLTCIARCSLGMTAETNEAPSGNYHLSHTDVTLGEATNEAFTLFLLNESGQKVSGAVYSSSDTTICTVESSGRVTAVGKGTATVTVTYGGQSYVCYIR